MTFSRRPGARFNRGRIATAAAAGGGPSADAPLSIVTSVTNIFFLSADLGVTIGTGVSLWENQGPTGATGDASQATGGSQPALQSAALNGKNTLLFDGADDFLLFAALDLPDPDITDIWFGFVFRQKTWTVNDSVYGANSTTALRLFQVTGSPAMRQNNGLAGNDNSGAAVDTWVRGEALYGSTAADYLKLGSTSSTPTSAGGNNPAAGVFTLGAHTTLGAGASHIEVATFAAWEGKPSAGELTALDAWVTSYYGAGVVV